MNDCRKLKLTTLLRRYLDNHCANADAEGMSGLCECRLCLDTRAELKVIVMANWFYLLGSLCFLIGTLINMVRK